MGAFYDGRYDVLLSTAIVESGLDVSTANTLIVYRADMFGLAQLYQIRGRVGRGSERSYCLLICEPTTPDAAERLRALAESTDGFVLAEKDLEIRGPGEVFGSRQSGASPFKVADLMKDRELQAMARRDARAWVEKSPALARAEETTLRRRLFNAYGDALGLGDVG